MLRRVTRLHTAASSLPPPTFLKHPPSTQAPNVFFDVVTETPSTVGSVLRHNIHSAQTLDAIPSSPNLVSMYMLTSYDRHGSLEPVVALIDNNTSSAIPVVLDALQQGRVTPQQLKLLIVTHAHLDHCAATGKLLQLCPHATVLCHPKARRHLVDPTQLIASARKVYTPEEFDKQVGDMIACDPHRVRAVADGETVSLVPGRDLTFHYTEGHASHHVIVHDPVTRSAFTGDSFGVSLNDLWQYGLKTDTVIPTSSPVDFDCAKAISAVELIRDLPIRRAWPTHFGPTSEVNECASQLLTLLPKYEVVRQEISWEMQRPKQSKARADFVRLAEQRMTSIVKEHLYSRGLSTDPESLWTGRLHLDISVNALGLVVAAERRPVRIL